MQFRPAVKSPVTSGFTLVELSIVLVIIGLIIGGVLVGRDLIAAATIRSQISQIEKYNAAVNTFRGKYGYLPGDMPQTAVTQFGFTAAPARLGIDSNGSSGRGNGNGILEGSDYAGGSAVGLTQGGETFWFWEDLSTNSGLINDNFNSATDAASGTGGVIAGTPQLDLYVPQAKIGNGDRVLAVSQNGQNYFYIGYMAFGGGFQNSIHNGLWNGTPLNGMVSSVAKQIDIKIDDGLPRAGRVQAQTDYNWVCYDASTPPQYFTVATLSVGYGAIPPVCHLFVQFQ